MENLKLNETPVRTAKNFRINNIKLENIEIPEVIPEFENVTITGDTSKIDIEQNADNIDINLAYGLSEELAVQVKAQANQKIKLNIKGTQNEKSKTENLEKAEAEIDFKFDDENSVLVDDIEITATENTKSTVVIKYTSNQESENYHNGIIKAKAEKDSELNIVLINLMNTKSNNFLAIENDFEENAKINYTIIDFGGKNSITNYYSNLEGDNCDNQLNTIYLGKENQLFDLNYIGELRGKKSNIDIEVQGALKDVAKKHFKGTIDFKKGCKKATGNENEACMLLSDTAKSIALPMLLCSEEEVEGNHSSSAGKIGEKELFYIMSRGFELKEAMKLMVRARFNKILENIKNEEFEKGLDELTQVVKYVRIFGIPEANFKVDLTIARGLDYYTGTVYETFLNQYRELGSVCSGGRYENLAEYYTDKKLPGVGISIGLTRLFYKLNELQLIKAEKKSIAEVLVVPMVQDLTVPIQIATDLRKKGISTEVYLNDKKLKAKMKYADKLEIPYVIVVGEDEINSGIVKIKNMKTGEEKETSIQNIEL